MSLRAGASGSIHRRCAALHWGSMAGAGHGVCRAGSGQRWDAGMHMCEDGGGTWKLRCNEQVERARSGNCTPASVSGACFRRSCSGGPAGD